MDHGLILGLVLELI